MPPLSGAGPTPAPRPAPTRRNWGQPKPMPPRQSNPSGSPVDRVKSTPDSRSGGSKYNVVNTNRKTPQVGGTPDSSQAASRTADFTAKNSSTPAGTESLTAAEKTKNLEAVQKRKEGILGCIGKSSATKSTGTCDPCDTQKCLEQMLVGNLLDVDAKKMLCDAVSSTEKALKRQIDSTGDALLNAANKLTSAQALQAPLKSLQGAINKIDPGQVAKCFGADALKKKINGQFNKVSKVISDAEKGVHDKIAEKFNKATEGLQQFSMTPNFCAGGPPVSLRSAIGG